MSSGSRSNYASSAGGGGGSSSSAGKSSKLGGGGSSGSNKKSVGLNVVPPGSSHGNHPDKDSPHISMSGNIAASSPSGPGKPGMKYALCLLKAICLLNKQVQVVKGVATSKYFQVWRTNCIHITSQSRRMSLTTGFINFNAPSDNFPTSEVLSAFSPTQDDGGERLVDSEQHEHVPAARTNSVMTPQKQNYLALFTENEKLREQLSDIRKLTATKEHGIRTNGGKMVMWVWGRAKYRSSIREYFDRWQCHTSTTKLRLDINHRELLLDVGKQQVDSYLSYLKETEATNVILKNNLFCSLYFLKWKTNACFATLNEERKLFNQQKRAFLTELQIVKQSLAAANRQEAAILHTAFVRGGDISNSLEHVRHSLSKALKMHKSLNEQSKARDQTLQFSGSGPGTPPVSGLAYNGSNGIHSVTPLPISEVSTPPPASGGGGSSGISLQRSKPASMSSKLQMM
jgi:hypothetical protein